MNVLVKTAITWKVTILHVQVSFIYKIIFPYFNINILSQLTNEWVINYFNKQFMINKVQISVYIF